MENTHDTIIDALFEHARSKPSQIAFKFCESGQEITITWAELACRAQTLSETIRQQTQSGDRVLLVYAPGLEFISAFLACCISNVIAIPCFPPTTDSLKAKLTAIIADAQPTLALHDERTATIENILSIDTAKLENIPEPQHQNIVNKKDIAFLQYSSGSTGEPKGVMISHANIVANIQNMIQTCDVGKETRFLCWMPHTHDMGLVGHLLLNIYLGTYLCLVPPSLMVRNPFTILMLLKEESLNTFGIPNFACELCVKRIKPEQLTQLDLSHLKTVTVGAEPINSKVLREFADKFACTGFNPSMFLCAYGLAENTLIASARRGLDTGLIDKKEIVNCGRAIETAIIVNSESLTECSNGESGEIWLAGASVATGYWNKPELTAQTLQAKLSTDSRHYLRTGDIACMKNGDLFVYGRIKEMMIFSGEKYFPQDIELTILNADEQLNQQDCAAFASNEKGIEHLVAIIKVPRDANDEALKIFTSKIRKSVLQHHQLAIKDLVFVTNSIPRTTSGKKQRVYCKKLYESQQLEEYFKLAFSKEEKHAAIIS